MKKGRVERRSGLKNISKIGKFQGAMWASHPTIW